TQQQMRAMERHRALFPSGREVLSALWDAVTNRVNCAAGRQTPLASRSGPPVAAEHLRLGTTMAPAVDLQDPRGEHHLFWSRQWMYFIEGDPVSAKPDQGDGQDKRFFQDEQSSGGRRSRGAAQQDEGPPDVAAARELPSPGQRSAREKKLRTPIRVIASGPPVVAPKELPSPGQRPTRKTKFPTPIRVVRPDHLWWLGRSFALP